MDANTHINDLTVDQLQQLIRETVAAALSARSHAPHSARATLRGNRALADFLGCSESTVRRYKAAGVFSKACAQRGRTIVYDAEKALQAFGAAKL